MVPFVTVIVPVYNDAVRIQTALRAVLEQTNRAESVEIIVVDDDSIDPARYAV